MHNHIVEIIILENESQTLLMRFCFLKSITTRDHFISRYFLRQLFPLLVDCTQSMKDNEILLLIYHQNGRRDVTCNRLILYNYRGPKVNKVRQENVGDLDLTYVSVT